ncbi:MAG: PfkB family carbohydrate kinase, partial [Runella zeae]
MSLQNTIYVIGSSNTDMVIKTPKLPMPGETVLGGNFLMNAGGKGANQAVAAARLGGNVVFVAKVGDDIFGKQALQQFTKEKINIQYIKTDPHHPSGVALINVDAKGENCISVAAGANGFLSEADITPVFEEMRPNDILLVQLEIPLST